VGRCGAKKSLRWASQGSSALRSAAESPQEDAGLNLVNSCFVLVYLQAIHGRIVSRRFLFPAFSARRGREAGGLVVARRPGKRPGRANIQAGKMPTGHTPMRRMPSRQISGGKYQAGKMPDGL
jgi:hypothetical protein